MSFYNDDSRRGFGNDRKRNFGRSPRPNFDENKFNREHPDNEPARRGESGAKHTSAVTAMIFRTVQAASKQNAALTASVATFLLNVAISANTNSPTNALNAAIFLRNAVPPPPKGSFPP